MYQYRWPSWAFSFPVADQSIHAAENRRALSICLLGGPSCRWPPAVLLHPRPDDRQSLCLPLWHLFLRRQVHGCGECGGDLRTHRGAGAWFCYFPQAFIFIRWFSRVFQNNLYRKCLVRVPGAEAPAWMYQRQNLFFPWGGRGEVFRV